MHLRLLYLSSHYRKNLDFSWKAMKQAKANFERLAEWLTKLKEIASGNSETNSLDFPRLSLGKMESAMDDDLNTPLAISALYDLITETNKKISKDKLSAEEAAGILAAFEKINMVFGLKFQEKETEIPEDVKKSVTDKIDALKKVVVGSDADAMNRASEELSREMQKIGEEIMKNQNSPENKEKKEGGDGGDVKDAEFKEEKGDDQKK